MILVFSSSDNTFLEKRSLDRATRCFTIESLETHDTWLVQVMSMAVNRLPFCRSSVHGPVELGSEMTPCRFYVSGFRLQYPTTHPYVFIV